MDTMTETPMTNQQPIKVLIEPQPPSLLKTTLWLLALLLLAQLVLGFALGVFYGMQQDTELDDVIFDTWFTSIPVLLSFTLASSLLTFPLLIKATNKNNWIERFDFWVVRKINGKTCAKWLLVALVFWVIVSALGEYLNLPVEQFMLDIKAANSSFALLSLIVVNMCIVIPIMEELIFRGWLFSRIAQTKLGSIGALFITSLIFTIIHAQYEQSFTFVMIFTLGLLLAFIRYKSNNISYSILMHIVFNSLSLFALLLL
jgi:membrane protease YdiL (CAAX protease family)